MTNHRRVALITGTSLIAMAMIAIFSIGYAYPQFDNPEQFEFLTENILQKKGLYSGMLIGIFIIIIFDLIVSFSLYKYFEDNHKPLSIASGILRAAYTVVFGIATYYLVRNLNTSELTNQLAISNFQHFQTIWNSGLVIFGFHILLIGYLMKLHSKIPKVLWSITLIAGLSYSVVSALTLENPNSEFVEILVMILALPMTIGELGLAVWFVIKGGKEPRA